MDFAAFLLWERASRDTIDFKKMYVDVAGDVYGGLMLSEIIYWYLPSERGVSKLRVQQDGFEWIAVRRYEWWDRIRFSPREADRALKVLEDAELIIKKVFKFGGEPTTHVRLNEAVFLEKIEALTLTPPCNPYHESETLKSPNGENEITKRGKRNHQAGKTESPSGENVVTNRGVPVTETPTETTAVITTSTTTERPRFMTWVQHGERYADRELIKVLEPTFEDACNAIFWKWLDMLQEFGAKPDTEPDALWEKNRAACVGLAKHRRTPEQVAGYMRAAYTNPKDTFWRSPLKPMNLTVVASNIGAWLSAAPGGSSQEHSDLLSDVDDPFGLQAREATLANLTPEQRIWELTYRQLELQLERDVFETWVKDATLLRVDEGCYVIGVPHRYSKDMLEQRLNRVVRRVFRESAGEQAEIRFEIVEAGVVT